MHFLVIVWSTVLCVLLFNLIQSYLKWKKWADRIDLIPGPPKLPLLGNALQISGKSPESRAYEFGRIFKKYGPVVRMWYGLNVNVLLCKAKHIEMVIKGSKNIEKSYTYEFLRPWLGDGLVMSKGSKWHSRRRMITPAFNQTILISFIDIFNAKSDILIKKLGRHSERKEAFEIYSMLSHATLDIVCETAMGTNIGAQEDKESDYIKAVYEISESMTYRYRRIWLYPQFIYNLTKHGKNYWRLINTLQSFTSKVTEERRLNRKNAMKDELGISEDAFGHKKRFALLDLLLDASENGSDLDEAAIREEVDTFMFGGHDTTATTVSWTLFLLGNHPQHQDLVAKELYEIFQGEDRPITFEDINEMKYLDRVLKESLRIFPPGPVISRKLNEDLDFDGHVVPSGANTFIHIYYLHRDPEVFPDPERFDPDRFLPENCEKRHPFAYLPFSAGPRNCIGQKFAMIEATIILASILRKFKVTSVDKIEDMRVLFISILRPHNGFNFKFEKRLNQT